MLLPGAHYSLHIIFTRRFIRRAEPFARHSEPKAKNLVEAQDKLREESTYHTKILRGACPEQDSSVAIAPSE
ncbi:MAG: hypothetical protein SCARUB_03023 [Candidatus Scalindua rubra]|uniref:Uncharacterized protein n=1 Tax=Candidatus Scalindua rubra TaxID=1872076 RepID=A0A1E3X886_9BACT|nr:MAG: hypothetical protein SCARUB_03023 [Candidatus Scalindua rubra]